MHNQDGTCNIVLLLFFSFSIQAVLIIYVAASFLSFLILLPFFIKLYKPWHRIKVAPTSKLIPLIAAHGKWSLFGQAIGQSTGSIRPWLIKFFVNTEAVALYSVAESMIGVLKMVFPRATLSALIPREIANKQRAYTILLRGLKYFFILGIVVSVIGFFVAPPIIHRFLPQYAPSIPLFQLLLVMLPFMSFRWLSNTFLVALRRQKYLFYVNVIKIIMSIVFPVLFLYFFGIFGMVFERILVMVIVIALVFGYLIKYEIPKPLLKTLVVFDKSDGILIKKIIHHFMKIIKNFLKRIKLYL